MPVGGIASQTHGMGSRVPNADQVCAWLATREPASALSASEPARPSGHRHFEHGHDGVSMLQQLGTAGEPQLDWSLDVEPTALGSQTQPAPDGRVEHVHGGAGPSPAGGHSHSPSPSASGLSDRPARPERCLRRCASSPRRGAGSIGPVGLFGPVRFGRLSRGKPRCDVPVQVTIPRTRPGPDAAPAQCECDGFVGTPRRALRSWCHRRAFPNTFRLSAAVLGRGLLGQQLDHTASLVLDVLLVGCPVPLRAWRG